MSIKDKETLEEYTREEARIYSKILNEIRISSKIKSFIKKLLKFIYSKFNISSLVSCEIY